MLCVQKRKRKKGKKKENELMVPEKTLLVKSVTENYYAKNCETDRFYYISVYTNKCLE